MANRVAMLPWESMHSIPVGGLAAHVTELAGALQRRGDGVHVFTRMGEGQPRYSCIGGVHYHRCPFDPNTADADRIGANGRQGAETRFSWDAIAEEMDSVYELI